MQTVLGLFPEGVRKLLLPAANSEVIAGVTWGRVECFFTPAYWAAQLWLVRQDQRALECRLTASLVEEAAVCMLGGHGITEEMCYAAFRSLQAAHLLKGERRVGVDEIEYVLRQPLPIGDRCPSGAV